MSLALDSEISRCVWHRAVLAGTLPPATRVDLYSLTAESEEPADLLALKPQEEWRYAGTWRNVHATATERGETDILLRSPPGRYLWLKLVFQGDGASTPRLGNLEIEFPRISLRRYLPADLRSRASVGGLHRPLARHLRSGAPQYRIGGRRPGEVLRSPGLSREPAQTGFPDVACELGRGGSGAQLARGAPPHLPQVRAAPLSLARHRERPAPEPLSLPRTGALSRLLAGARRLRTLPPAAFRPAGVRRGSSSSITNCAAGCSWDMLACPITRSFGASAS